MVNVLSRFDSTRVRNHVVKGTDFTVLDFADQVREPISVPLHLRNRKSLQMLKTISPVKTLASIFFVAIAALAQDDARTVAKVEAVAFPPLPRMARIQGDVRLRSGPEGVTLLSGHPLVAPVA